MDLLILHFGRLEKNRLSIIHMPYKAILLCDFLAKNSIKASIFNAAAETANNKKFSLIGLIEKYDPEIIGLTLQWHSQMKGVFEASRRIKKKFPQKKIVVGGITASFFSRQILEKEKSIDYVIRGDAEIPALKLCRQIKSGKTDLKSIENISYRQAGRIYENPVKYKISRRIFNSLSYSSFSHILNIDSMLNVSNNFYVKVKNGVFYSPEPPKKRFFYIASRGCVFNCSYCSASAYHRLCGRTSPVYKSPETVCRDIKKLLSYGIENIYFPTFPDSFRENNFYTKLFKIFIRKNITFNCTIDCFHLPRPPFLEIFQRTFKNNLKDSHIVLSPDLLDEKKRKLNKGQLYSNRELFSFIYAAQKYGINVRLSLAAGLPFASRSDYSKTLLYAERLSSFSNLEITMNTIPIEPYSPLFLNPEKYKVKLKCKNFNDFLLKKPGELGYETDQLSERQIFQTISVFNRVMSRASEKFKKIDIKNIN